MSPTVICECKRPSALHQLAPALEQVACVVDDLLALVVKVLAAIHQLATAGFHCLATVLCRAAQIISGVLARPGSRQQGRACAHHKPRQEPSETVAFFFHVPILTSILPGAGAIHATVDLWRTNESAQAARPLTAVMR